MLLSPLPLFRALQNRIRGGDWSSESASDDVSTEVCDLCVIVQFCVACDIRPMRFSDPEVVVTGRTEWCKIVGLPSHGTYLFARCACCFDICNSPYDHHEEQFPHFQRQFCRWVTERFYRAICGFGRIFESFLQGFSSHEPLHDVRKTLQRPANVSRSTNISFCCKNRDILRIIHLTSRT